MACGLHPARVLRFGFVARGMCRVREATFCVSRDVWAATASYMGFVDDEGAYDADTMAATASTISLSGSRSPTRRYRVHSREENFPCPEKKICFVPRRRSSNLVLRMRTRQRFGKFRQLSENSVPSTY